jgi:Kef-type K+ transport system membrane component KefB
MLGQAAADMVPDLVPADMVTILLDLALIIVLARIVGWAFGQVGMPPVVGEILAGVILGPSIFGAEFSETLFPLDQRGYLELLANLGLVLFMFVVGLELDTGLIHGRGRVAGVVSACSIVAPFTLGLLLALYLADSDLRPDEVGFWPFALFMGASMSVTAFPVLARILTDRNMHRTETGGLALACAAVDDVLAWTLLAVVIGIAGGDASDDASWTVALAIPFAVLALVVVRPQLRRLTDAYRTAGRLTPNILAIVLVGLLVFSATTEYLHVHFIFGAFLFGAIMPQGADAAPLRHEILVRLEQISVLLLLPVFFLVAGLNVNIRGLDPSDVLPLVAILAVAVGGKYFGAYAGARLSGVPGWQARSLGVLMNTRGLTELVILTVGLDAELISLDLYTLLVIMALVTTMMTGPLLRRTYPDRRVARDIAEAERAKLGGEAAAFRVLLVADPERDNLGRLEVALALAVRQRPAEVVVASLHRQQHQRLDVGTGLTDELAAITSSMERLELLVGRGEEVGIPVKISSHLTSDMGSDLLALAGAITPQVVVAGAVDDGYAALLGGLEVEVVTVVAAEPAPSDADAITVRWRPDADGDAAVVLGCRVAALAGVAVHLTAEPGGAGRRFAGLQKALTDRGVRLTGAPPAFGVSVGAHGTAHVDVTTRAERDPAPVDWATVDLGTHHEADLV